MKESLVTPGRRELHLLNTASIAALLSSNYGFDSAVCVTEMSSGPANSVWKVESPSCSVQRFFCLKRHCTSVQRIRLEHNLIQKYRQHQFELIPQVIPALNGDSVCFDAGSSYSLYDFVACDESFNWTESGWGDNHAQQAASVLADFHQVGIWVAGDLSVEQEHMLTWLEAPLLTGGIDWGCASTWLPESALALVTGCGSSSGELAGGPVDQALLIHGDFHPGNLLFGQGRVVGLLDLDYLRLGSSRFDLAYGMVSFGLDSQSGGFNEIRALSFLKAYHERSLSLPSFKARPGLDCATLRPELLFAARLIALWLIEQSQKDDYQRQLLAPALHSVFCAMRMYAD